MFKYIAALLLMVSPVLAKQPSVKYHTIEATGCMILEDCKDEVFKIETIEDLKNLFPDKDFSLIEEEVKNILASLKNLGINFFIGVQKYFPEEHRGLYHTLYNKMFMNKAFINRPHRFLSVLRHEGWHVAQDCMAGTIDNNFVAIIHEEKDIPTMPKVIAMKTYKHIPQAIPFEMEAIWAAGEPKMTQKALEVCNKGVMWESYKPTPLTKKFLVEQGYMTQ